MKYFIMEIMAVKKIPDDFAGRQNKVFLGAPASGTAKKVIFKAMQKLFFSNKKNPGFSWRSWRLGGFSKNYFTPERPAMNNEPSEFVEK